MIKDPKSKMVYGRRRGGGVDRRNRSEPVRGNFGERDRALREAAARRRLAGGELGQPELERLELAAWASGWTSSTRELARPELAVWASGWTISTRRGLRLVVLLGALGVLEVAVLAGRDQLWQVEVVVLFDLGLLHAVEIGHVALALLLASIHFRDSVSLKRAGPIIAFWVRPK